MSAALKDLLKDKSLFREEAYIAGRWVGSAEKINVTNPANGQVIGTIPALGRAETLEAIKAAESAQKTWAATPAKQRGQILRRWFELMMENQDDLGRIMTAEQGKPLPEAKGEVAYGASFVEFFAEEARRIYGETIPSPWPNARIVAIKQPVGVVAAITPWNFPNAMITRKAGPALAAGCAFVVKPSEETPYSALALAELAERAGLPKGVFSVVTGHAKEIGGEMTSNPIVRALSFTGSTAVGKLLMAQCATTVKKVGLELGGNAPFIVFDDADLDAAVAGAMASKYRNAGQTCVCANRLIIQDGIYDAFAEKLAKAVATLKVGDGFGEGVTTGPLINAKAIAKVEDHIADALKKGGKVVTGGKRHALGGSFFEPTVIRDVTADMLIAREETFGPVAPLFRFKSEEEAIHMANDTEFGLACYFYTRDIGRVWRVGEALEYGIVGINEGIISTAEAPFGGVKESGIGREGSLHGIEEYTEIKYMLMGGLGK
ncbi:MAG: succinic semialdehyde dehydrogenase [Pseudomonadota bacterium]|jgi:succinate-semialdehyde dehydrogenase/glutarate-semialdehyde dehydrogenase|nr:NAD-dependent succinate-semialdehyde dehydrogenase [Alphaproteobacteria bacterium]